MTADLAGLLVANGLFLVAGAGVTRACGWWRGWGVLRAAGTAYLAGVAAYGLAAQFLLVLGAPLVRWQVVAVCAALAALGFVRTRPLPRPELTLGRADVLIASAALAMLGLLVVDYWYQPLWSYDAWTFWTPKARALAALGGLDAGWFTSADLANRDYPLLLPAVEAAGFRFTGYETGLLDLQSLLLVVGFAGAYVDVVRARCPALPSWSVLASVLLAPALAVQAGYAQADLPVAVFLAGAGLAAAVWLESEAAGALALAALLAGGAVATKIEGLTFAIALFVALAGTALGISRRASLAAGAAGAVAVAVALVPWRLWLAVHDVPLQASPGRALDLGFMAQHASRAPTAAADVLARFVDPTAWLLVVPVAAAATLVALARRRRTLPLFALATVVLSLAGLVLAYWTTPLDFEFHLATSARRVVDGPILFWAGLAPLLLRDAGLFEPRLGSRP